MFGSELSLIDGFLVSLMTMLFITAIIKFSAKIGMLDIPNDRSSHVNPTPRGAGVAMFFAYMAVLFLFHWSFVQEYSGFFIALILIFAVGVYDDNKGVSPKIKFVAIIIATLLIFFINDFRIDTMGTWFGLEMKLPWIFSLILTIFVLIFLKLI
jgi:UDP-GlcNAc:undecaprenyl-phosphate GlcNAc-1-phosphate transferase